MQVETPSVRSVVHEFEDEYFKEYLNKVDLEEYSYPEWEEIKQELFKDWHVEVRTVNSGGASLDYDNHSETGLTVIAIGGLALSRGLTLEGLCNAYSVTERMTP